VIGALQTLKRHELSIYPNLWDIGESLSKGLNDLGVKCAGHAPRSTIKLKAEERDELTRKLIPMGILLGQPNYATAPHTDDHVLRTLKAVEEVIQ
jgi:hypothetical protein